MKRQFNSCLGYAFYGWLTVMSGLLAGCYPEKPKPVVLDHGPTLGDWPQFLEAKATSVKNAYVMVGTGATDGMFPCSIAVARIGKPWPVIAEENSALALLSPDSTEMIGWMELFDDTWVVSEVFPVSYPGIAIRAGFPDSLIDHARDGGARICVMYSVNQTSKHHAEASAIVYDAKESKVLGSVHADSHVMLPEIEQDYPPPPPGRVPTDYRHLDPKFIAMKQLRKQTRACILDLIVKDKPRVAPDNPQAQTTGRVFFQRSSN